MRVALCGDPAVGKSSIIHMVSTGSPEGELCNSNEVQINEEINLIDTDGQEDQDRIRSIALKDASAYILCYSTISPNSYNNVVSKWFPQVSRANAENRPLILVGTKSDLRNDKETLKRLESKHLAPITYEKGLCLQKEIGAQIYLETSSNDLESIEQLKKTIISIFDKNSSEKIKTLKKKEKSLKKVSCSLV